jgi:hypothetical protein
LCAPHHRGDKGSLERDLKEDRKRAHQRPGRF